MTIRGDKLINDTVAPLWNKAKNGVKIQKGEFEIFATVEHFGDVRSGSDP